MADLSLDSTVCELDSAPPHVSVRHLQTVREVELKDQPGTTPLSLLHGQRTSIRHLR